MKNGYLFFLLMIYGATSYAQQHKVFVVDEHNLPINDFKLYEYRPDSILVLESHHKNYFWYNKLNQKDSIRIHYDSFYEESLDLRYLAKNDTIQLSKAIALDEVVLDTKSLDRLEIGANVGALKIHRIVSAPKGTELAEISVSKYKGAKIQSISLYLYESFHHDYYEPEKKRTNQFKTFELYLFQSDETPNSSTYPLLSKPLRVHTDALKKGWFTIDLKELDISIQDHPYLYVGFGYQDVTAYGYVLQKRVADSMEWYVRQHSIHNKVYYTKPKFLNERDISVPAIKLEILATGNMDN